MPTIAAFVAVPLGAQHSGATVAGSTHCNRIHGKTALRASR